tara:strand:- start:1615 stop:2286 length:672 start_codon:yes stop_codon:yes gene_type:complete
MTNGKGLQWITLDKLNWNSGTVGEYYGATGDVITHEQLQADIDREDVVMLMVDGFEKVHIKGLCKNFDIGSASTNDGAEIWIWGALGFGEPYSKVWNENPLLAYRLGGFQWNRGNQAGVSTTTAIQGPEGETLGGAVQDHRIHGSGNGFDGSMGCHDHFAGLAEGKKLGVATPDGETLISTGDNDGNGGMLNLVGVGMFQMILFVLYNQDHVSIDMNFACARS